MALYIPFSSISVCRIAVINAAIHVRTISADWSTNDRATINRTYTKATSGFTRGPDESGFHKRALIPEIVIISDIISEKRLKFM